MKILVAGIGNIFLGDDAFGVEVVRLLARRAWPEGVEVRDFGIRGFDLAYALMDEFDLSILIDAVPRGGPPGSLYWIEPDWDDLGGTGAMDAHGMNPVQVLRLVLQLGGRPTRVLVLGCEPESFGSDDGRMELSCPVQSALGEAVRMVEEMVEREMLEQEGVWERPESSGLATRIRAGPLSRGEPGTLWVAGEA